MKKIVVLCVCMIFFFIDTQAATNILVSGQETTSFLHAFGWVITFNVFIMGGLFIGVIGKKIVHISFIIFLPLAGITGYFLMHSYTLDILQEVPLVALCFIPGIFMYTYGISVFRIKYAHNHSHTEDIVYPTNDSPASIERIQSINKVISKLSHFFSHIISFSTYLLDQTPSKRRKEYLRKLGWDVDAPETFPTHLILHRTKNPLLICSVSRNWKHIPIHQTRSLGLLSEESQQYIRDTIEYIRFDFIKSCKEKNILMDEKNIQVGKRKYTPNDLISRMERNTPLGLHFLHIYLRETLEA